MINGRLKSFKVKMNQDYCSFLTARLKRGKCEIDASLLLLNLFADIGVIVVLLLGKRGSSLPGVLLIIFRTESYSMGLRDLWEERGQILGRYSF